MYVFFQLFSTIKVNLVAKIMQSAYLSVIIHVKQLPFLAVLTVTVFAAILMSRQMRANLQ